MNRSLSGCLQLEAEVRQLAKAHEEQLRPGGEGFFDNVNDGDTKVERLNNNISKLFHKCNDQVKMLSNPQLGNDADLKVSQREQWYWCAAVHDIEE